jgi:thiol-disulfide isomerase/thioredoxin
MKNYYYVHTGHRIGLDRFRRAATIVRALDELDITLLCSDYRIAQVARDFGVKNSVGIDVVRNIPQISEKGDNLIFDSDEANPIMIEDMKKYFSNFIHVENTNIIVDEKYFEQKEKTIKISYFFGDDDYSKDLEKHLDFIKDLEPDLLLGFYYFLDYEDMLKEKFKNSHEFEDYDEVIQHSEILITASPQAVLESLASGAKPIYFQRQDYTEDFLELFKSLNIPIVFNYEKAQLIDIISNINTHKYSELQNNCYNFTNLIKENLN